MHQWVFVTIVSVTLICTVTFLIIYTPFYVVQHEPSDPYAVARRVLKTAPLVDGHNGFPNNLHRILENRIQNTDFRQNLTEDPIWGMKSCPTCHSDIVRLKEGIMGTQLWAVGCNCETEFKDAVEQTMEQIDVMYRFIDMYPDVFQYAGSAADIEYARYDGKIGAMFRIEGGHTIDNRLSVLRNYYKLGVRAMTLSFDCNTPWVESSGINEEVKADPDKNSTGLSDFGLLVIEEMNRLGMIIDLTHSSLQTQMDVFNHSRAPVIFSHSNAYALCDNHRNVRDEVLHLVRDHGGLVMVNFDASSVNCSEEATIAEVADQINHIRNVSGVDHVGIGSLFDTTNRTVTGLEDVSKFIELFAYLADESDENYPEWTEIELQKLAGRNFLNVFKAVEAVSAKMRGEGKLPVEEWIAVEDLTNHTECITLMDEL
ncbi:dipeptidase 1-like [Neocloeon triangulifer]|uniref:dipeptidase 1-like n=1 Tax=Neocloeon triangulifer TaxID=2078957 RepID=UPI00286EE2C8|nr:dipeptidase 1-like [Neocloeon triangulifer]